MATLEDRHFVLFYNQCNTMTYCSEIVLYISKKKGGKGIKKMQLVLFSTHMNYFRSVLLQFS